MEREIVQIEENPAMITLKGLEENLPTELNVTQLFLQNYLESIQIFWWVIWLLVLVVVSYKYILKKPTNDVY